MSQLPVIPDPDAPRPTRTVIIQRSPDPAPGPPSASGGRSGCFWLLGGCATVLVAIALGLVLLLLAGGATLNNLTANIQRLLNPPPAASIITSQSLMHSIQPMGQLVTISTRMAKADIDVSIAQGVLGSRSFTTSHVAQGTIEAGIDLTRLTPEDIQFDAPANAYIIRLPAAALTSCRVDYIRQYAYEGTLLPVDRDESRLLAQYVALTEFRDDALAEGILNRAEQQAQLVFGNVIQAMTGASVVIEFQTGQPSLPDSCQPLIPGNWTYDPATQTWTQTQ